MSLPNDNSIIFQVGNLSGAIIPDLKLDVFSRTMDVNVNGLVLCLRAVSRVMSEQEPLEFESLRHGKRSLGRGSIVTIGSGLIYAAAPGLMPYVVSKHAVAGVTKTAGE